MSPFSSAVPSDCLVGSLDTICKSLKPEAIPFLPVLTLDAVNVSFEFAYANHFIVPPSFSATYKSAVKLVSYHKVPSTGAVVGALADAS